MRGVANGGAASGQSRRRFLEDTLRFGAGVAAASWWPRRSRAQSVPRIVIVGGGLAGLTAAHELQRRFGLTADVYEANDCFGGRVSTERAFGGQYVERGGQFVNSADQALRRLVHMLGVGLVDLNEVGADGEERLYFRNRGYLRTELAPALAQVEATAALHAREAGRQARFDRHNARTEYWDHVTIAQWIDTYCPGGLDGAAGRYLTAYFETEFAGPTSVTSALELIYELGVKARPATYDERYVVAGGTDTIVSALLARLPAASLHPAMPLRRLQANVDGSVRCTFDTVAGSVEVNADRAILALPFSTLRDIDYAAMGFDARKHDAIQGLGIGTNAKVHLQFEGAPWSPTYAGDSISDLVSGVTWDETAGQPGTRHSLVLFNGGANAIQYGATAAHGPASTTVTASHLAALDTLFPGASAAFTGVSHLDNWVVDPWVKGSYSFYLAGQMTAFGGYERASQGRVHFAGEHTATKYVHRGTLNGAVESGLRVAREVVHALRS